MTDPQVSEQVCVAASGGVQEETFQQETSTRHRPQLHHRSWCWGLFASVQKTQFYLSCFEEQLSDS